MPDRGLLRSSFLSHSSGFTGPSRPDRVTLAPPARVVHRAGHRRRARLQRTHHQQPPRRWCSGDDPVTADPSDGHRRRSAWRNPGFGSAGPATRVFDVGRRWPVSSPWRTGSQLLEAVVAGDVVEPV